MDKLKLFEATFQKISSDDTFLAYYFKQYATRHQISLEEVMESLHCSPENFYKLALCRAPERHRADFTERLGNIAGYAGVSLIALDSLMKAAPGWQEKTSMLRLPALLDRWYRVLSEFPATRWAIARMGISACSVLFFIGVLSARVDNHSNTFYSKGFSYYKDSIQHICQADHTTVSVYMF